MYIDALLRFTGAATGVGNSDGATDSPTTGTQNSSNVIDLGISSGIPSNANGGGARDIGIGNPAMKLLVQVSTTFSGGTSLQLALQGAVDDGTGVPAAFSNWWLSPAYAEAALNAGSRLYDMDMPRPPDGIAIPRFLRMGYITVGTHSAGALSAQIVLDRDDHAYSSTDNSIYGGYPAGLNVAN